MKNGFFVLLLVSAFILSLQCGSAAQLKTGALVVISEIDPVEIYVDGSSVGMNIAKLKEIAVGNHYISIKMDGLRVFDKIVIVQEGEQTTLVYKGDEPPEQKSENLRKSPPPAAVAAESTKTSPFNFLLSYGTYAGNASFSYSGQSFSASTTYPSSFTGIGVSAKNYFDEAKSLFVSGSVNYNTKVEATQLTYLTADLGFSTQSTEFELGINYPFWQADGLALNSVIGFQAALSYFLTENLAIGLKYALFKGSGSESYYGYDYRYDISFSQPLLVVTIR